MSSGRYLLQRLGHGLLLMVGVTLLSFVLMVQFGPDQTYELVGKNATTQQIEELRQSLGYDQPLVQRYLGFLNSLVRLDFGLSNSNGEPVTAMLARSLPVTLMLLLPGFVLGNVLGIVFGLLAAWYQGSWPDRLITGLSVAGLSVSFLVVIIALQILLCTPYGLNLFPARGWQVDGFGSYVWYVTVPSLALILITLGYNTRFYRAVLVEELHRDHVEAARAFGASTLELLFRHTLRNSLVAIVTRVVFSIPLIIVSGSLLLETYFGIPGIGKVTFDAISSGDQPVLLAVVSMTAVLFVVAQISADLCCRLADPRTGLS